MRYLLLFVLAICLGSCQDNTSVDLIQENADLQLKVNLAEQTTIKAEAMALLAQQEAQRAMEMARAAQAEAEKQKVALEKCKSGK